MGFCTTPNHQLSYSPSFIFGLTYMGVLLFSLNLSFLLTFLKMSPLKKMSYGIVALLLPSMISGCIHMSKRTTVSKHFSLNWKGEHNKTCDGCLAKTRQYQRNAEAKSKRHEWDTLTAACDKCVNNVQKNVLSIHKQSFFNHHTKAFE